MSKILNPLELENMLKEKQQYNYRTFRTLNAHNIEQYVLKQIEKELKNPFISLLKRNNDFILKNPYNKKYDIILYYNKRKYTVEVKAGKRFIIQTNGNNKNGIFKFGIKIFTNKPHIIAFCSYYKEHRFLYYCLGIDVINFLKNKRKVKNKYYSITHKQLHQILKPKNRIKDIIKLID